MSLNQSLISDFSEYYRWSQRTKIKYKLHYGWCTGRSFIVEWKSQPIDTFLYRQFKLTGHSPNDVLVQPVEK